MKGDGRKGDRRRETGQVGQENREARREKGDRRRETGGQEKGDRSRGTGEGGREKGEGRRKTECMERTAKHEGFSL